MECLPEDSRGCFQTAINNNNFKNTQEWTIPARNSVSDIFHIRNCLELWAAICCQEGSWAVDRADAPRSQNRKWKRPSFLNDIFELLD